VHLDEPVFLIGHSFGGGVAIRFAHDYPERVRSLVLVNSIGGSAWKSGSRLRSLADRPLWDWGLHFPSDIWPIPQATKVIPIMLEDALPNLLRNPRAMLKVGFLARRVDLTYELEALKQRELPVVVLWGTRDGIIPRESFDALCAAVGAEGQVVDGSHSWMLADPIGFGEVITNAVDVARVARELEAGEPPRRGGFLGKDRRRPRTLRTVAGAKPSDES
jgi:pimeloyl-ACP methyl ester carboxylesterase